MPVSFTDTVQQGSCSGNYTIVRAWSAADSCDNQASEDQSIEVRDTTPPELALPADLTLAVPSTETPRIQEAHIAIGHVLCELVDEALHPRPEP